MTIDYISLNVNEKPQQESPPVTSEKKKEVDTSQNTKKPTANFPLFSEVLQTLEIRNPSFLHASHTFSSDNVTDNTVIFDEIVEDSELYLEASKTMVSRLFSPSSVLLAQIIEFFTSHKVTLLKEPPASSDINYFQTPEGYYPILDEHVDELYSMMCGLQNNASFEHVFKKSPHVLPKLLTALDNPLLFTHKSLKLVKKLSPNVLAQLISKSLSSIISTDFLSFKILKFKSIY